MSAILMILIVTSLSILIRLWNRELHNDITFSPAIYLIGAAFNVVLLRGGFDPFPTMGTLDKMMVLVTGSSPLALSLLPSLSGRSRRFGDIVVDTSWQSWEIVM